MKVPLFASVALVALLAVGTTLSTHETEPVFDPADYDAALQCDGDGLINVIAGPCMHDGGSSASGDSLEIYCYHGIARFCLSGEDCTFRGSPSGIRVETCSRAGLSSDWMATASCDGWNGFHDFECTESGQIKLQREAREATPSTCGAPD